MTPGSNGTQAPAAAPAPQAAPQATRRQGRMALRSVATMWPGLPGMMTVGAGDYWTYREMLANPTVQIARAAAMAPVKKMEWTFDADDDTPDEITEFVSEAITRLREPIVGQACRACDFGFQAFEVVWVYDAEGGRVVPSFVKPLLPDLTNLMVNEGGELVQVANTGATLSRGRFLVYSYDVEGDDWYGRSRLENIRDTAWRAWKDTFGKSGKYTTKCSTVVPIMVYPIGESVDPVTGDVTRNEDIAAAGLSKLAQADGIAMPRSYSAATEDMLREATGSLAELADWEIKFLETRAGHGTELVAMLQHWERLMVRGYLLPERAATEGVYGNKAEAEAHGDIGIAIAEEVAAGIVASVNRDVIEHLLVANFGERYRKAVRLRALPLSDEAKGFFRDVAKQLLADPAYAAKIDADSLLDGAGLPKSEEIVDVASEDPAVVGQPADPAATVATGTTPATAAVPAGGAAVQDTALNGSQIDSLMGMIEKAAANQIPMASLKPLLQAAFPSMPESRIDALIAPLANFKPAAPPEDAATALMRGVYSEMRKPALELAQHKYSTAMVYLPHAAAQVFEDAFGTIDPNDIAEDLGDDPHVTIRYGLHTQDPEDVRRVIGGSKRARIRTADVVSIFENPDADVVKVDVESEDLVRMNADLASLPHTDTKPGYKPHVTIAYVKPGTGKKYAGAKIRTTEFGVSKVVFSDTNGAQSEIALGG